MLNQINYSNIIIKMKRHYNIHMCTTTNNSVLKLFQNKIFLLIREGEGNPKQEHEEAESKGEGENK